MNMTNLHGSIGLSQLKLDEIIKTKKINHYYKKMFKKSMD